MYAATLNGRRLTFEVECVWRRNMIIRDRETGTLWQHATGEALIGPLKGERLGLLGGALINWGGWKAIYPNTQAALEPAEWAGLFSKESVNRVLEKATSFAVVPGKTRDDKRLPALEMVIGVLVDGAPRAYRLADLARSGALEETVNGRKIRVIYDEEHQSVQALADGDRLDLKRTRWMGWYEFHPDTTVFEPAENKR